MSLYLNSDFFLSELRFIYLNSEFILCNTEFISHTSEFISLDSGFFLKVVRTQNCDKKVRIVK